MALKDERCDEPRSGGCTECEEVSGHCLHCVPCTATEGHGGTGVWKMGSTALGINVRMLSPTSGRPNHDGCCKPPFEAGQATFPGIFLTPSSPACTRSAVTAMSTSLEERQCESTSASKTMPLDVERERSDKTLANSCELQLNNSTTQTAAFAA